MGDNSGPDWGQVGSAAGAVILGLAAFIAHARGLFNGAKKTQTGEHQERVDAEDARQARRDQSSLDLTKQTLSGAYDFMAKLQAEIVRKDEQLREQEARCAKREHDLEQRIVDLDRMVARQGAEIRDLSRGRG